mgnify:CR=1 FL=1
MKYTLKELTNNSSQGEIELALITITIALSKSQFTISKEIYDSLDKFQQAQFNVTDTN